MNSWQEKYSRYIASSEWQHKRRARIKLDSFKCRTCWETENLEVHHLTYDRLGQEELSDLITLCKHCHEAITNSIRERRYKNREIKFNDVAKRKELNYVETTRSEIDWSKSVINAQRSVSRPSQPPNKRNEENFWQEEENGQRFRRAGKA